jgi:hypothetical protein
MKHEGLVQYEPHKGSRVHHLCHLKIYRFHQYTTLCSIGIYSCRMVGYIKIHELEMMEVPGLKLGLRCSM